MIFFRLGELWFINRPLLSASCNLSRNGKFSIAAIQRRWTATWRFVGCALWSKPWLVRLCRGLNYSFVHKRLQGSPWTNQYTMECITGVKCFFPIFFCCAFLGQSESPNIKFELVFSWLVVHYSRIPFSDKPATPSITYPLQEKAIPLPKKLWLKCRQFAIELESQKMYWFGNQTE